MDIVVNYWGVISATVASVVLGTLWYGPFFGKQWMTLMGITMGEMTPEKKAQMWKSYFFMTVGSLVMSYVLTHSLFLAMAFYQTSGISAGLMAGFWNWLGFVMPVTLGVVLWEGKPWKLWFINSGYYLVALLLMGCVLSFFM